MKHLLVFFAAFLLLAACVTQKEKDYSYLYDKESKFDVAGKTPSPFVGKWRWVYEKDGVQYLYVDIGERSDSLLVTFYCILDYGNFYNGPMLDNDGKPQAEICIASPKSGNTIQGVIYSKPYDYMEAPFDNVFLRLIDKNTLVVKVIGGDYYFIPREMAFKRENNDNMEFSHIVEYIYADSVALKK